MKYSDIKVGMLVVGTYRADTEDYSHPWKVAYIENGWVKIHTTDHAWYNPLWNERAKHLEPVPNA